MDEYSLVTYIYLFIFRAAMVAAMELVAKKQVTDDMRVGRVRKHVLKPLPPKGRGRRAIFKKMNKVRSMRLYIIVI
jgi:hypothetical protein